MKAAIEHTNRAEVQFRMIRKLVFKNYRCFENSEIDFRNISVIVGNNNAGKSTLIEALRIVSFASQKFKHTVYVPAPPELELPATVRGMNLNIDHLKIDLRTIVHKYKENVFAQVSAFFDNKAVIRVYLSNEVVFSYVEVDGKIITKKYEALKVDDLNLHIMPQIGLIREDEPKLATETIQRDMSTRLSSRHFRNELLLYKSQHFETFRELAQSTWPGLRISNISYNANESKVELVVFDANYAAEIGLMGSGLQMWLQIIWFISRCPIEGTIVLDEPDVYMHPDLQRKILRIVQKRFRQIIIATHSVEIISGVEPYQIVTINKNSRRMQYAGNYRAVQEVINNLGSNHNLSLVRLGNAKKCVFVEGKDIKTLTKFQSILSPDNQISLDQLPTVELGGWSRFDEALGAARLFFEETKGEIETYCILDRDYHTDTEISELYRKATESHLTLHIWECKEIENYILTPQSIFRVADLPPDSFDSFANDLFEALNSLREETLGGIMDQLASCDKSKTPSYFYKTAEAILNPKWDTLEGRLSVANGKNLISTINAWVRSKYKKSCSRTKLINALSPEDISQEVKEVIKQISP